MVDMDHYTTKCQKRCCKHDDELGFTVARSRITSDRKYDEKYGAKDQRTSKSKESPRQISTREMERSYPKRVSCYDTTWRLAQNETKRFTNWKKMQMGIKDQEKLGVPSKIVPGFDFGERFAPVINDMAR